MVTSCTNRCLRSRLAALDLVFTTLSVAAGMNVGMADGMVEVHGSRWTQFPDLVVTEQLSTL